MLRITIGDNSTYKFQRALLLKLGFHYVVSLALNGCH